MTGVSDGKLQNLQTTNKFNTATLHLLEEMATKEAQVIELYELHYSDLLSLPFSSCEEDELCRKIMETLGPTGPGLLSITGVPNVSLLRRTLLPLASKLALLPQDSRKSLLKEHNLGSDVSLKNPDRNVSSFAMQLKYADALAQKPSLESSCLVSDDGAGKLRDANEFGNLSTVFKEVGYCMMELGLCLARICDKFIGGDDLEQSLLESGTAKGRLIHYHSVLDNLLLRGNGRKKGAGIKQVNSRSEQKQLKGLNLVTDGGMKESCGDRNDLWQQWHYDYGIFTVLTAPMFLMPSNVSENTAIDQCLIHEECPYPDGFSYLQIFDPNKNAVLMVKTSPESFIIQVGESADILSKGKLRSTLHCVSRPEKLENVSRETFVVFLQPAWSKTFSISEYMMENSMSIGRFSNEENDDANHGKEKTTQDFNKIIPPLSSRLKDEMTFAEFSRETTKQYYGGSGLQSNR